MVIGIFQRLPPLKILVSFIEVAGRTEAMVEAIAATGAIAGVKVGAGGNEAGANVVWRAATKAVLVFSSSARRDITDFKPVSDLALS